MEILANFSCVTVRFLGEKKPRLSSVLMTEHTTHRAGKPCIILWVTKKMFNNIQGNNLPSRRYKPIHNKDTKTCFSRHLPHFGQQQFLANKKKCDFGRRHIRYLGHMIKELGVEMDSEKVTAVLDWPEPKNIKALRGFLALTGYYWRFIKNYGKIAQPLTDLLKKGQFNQSQQSTDTMKASKETITTTPVLALLDFTQTFHVDCDTSGRWVGAVLSQNKKPIAYFRKAL